MINKQNKNIKRTTLNFEINKKTIDNHYCDKINLKTFGNHYVNNKKPNRRKLLR